jgi:hypothetical protein
LADTVLTALAGIVDENVDRTKGDSGRSHARFNRAAITHIERRPHRPNTGRGKPLRHPPSAISIEVVHGDGGTLTR